jgi:hypothetical protein
VKAICAACGRDCSNANATWNGGVYHVGCIPAGERKPPTRRHRCWNCGNDMGEWDRRYCYSGDTCGARDCEIAARDAQQQERNEAHDALDRDRGW